MHFASMFGTALLLKITNAMRHATKAVSQRLRVGGEPASSRSWVAAYRFRAFRSSQHPAVWAIAVVPSLLLLPVATHAQSANYTLTPVNYPGATAGTTTANGINDSGQIVGQYQDSSSNTHGFLDNNGIFTSINYPNATKTVAYGINNSGEIAGYYVDSAGNSHAFTLNGSTFSSFDYPGAATGSTQGYGINDSGILVGQYADPNTQVLHGFTYNGTYSSISYPSASNTLAFGINNGGQISGYYYDSSGQIHGFVDNGGTFTAINVSPSPTYSFGINNAGAVLGEAGACNGTFIYSNGVVTTVVLTPTTTICLATGINNSGQIVGFYSNLTGSGGFVGTPVNLPRSSAKNNGLGCDCIGNPQRGDPITVANGNLFEQKTDYTTVGQNPLAFTRYYNSQASSTRTLARELGVNWRSNFDRYLQLSASTVIVERADGQQLTFTLNGSTWTTDTDVDVTLTNNGSTWTLKDHNDVTETYAALSLAEAQLNTIQTRNGYTQTMHYNASNQLTSVTDSYGRQLRFTYNTNGTLNTLATPDSTTITYAYTAAGGGNNLTSVTFPTSPASVLTYVYGENSAPANALTGIIDENNTRYATWKYDTQGRATSSQLGTGSNANVTTLTYNANGTVTVQNALGVQDTYTFTTLQSMPKVTKISRAAIGVIAAATETFTYDTNGYLASTTDWNGNQTTFVNDAHGDPTTISEAVGSPVARTTTVAYDATFVHLPASITTPGLTTSFTYDTGGNVLTQTLTDTTSQTAPYSTNGQKRTWTKTWSNFLLVTIKTPNGNTATFGYDSSSALTSVTNALNQQTKITAHTGSGLPTTIVDPNGVTTTLTYDPRQRLLASSVSTSVGARTTSYTYDAAGNLSKTTLSDNSFLSLIYDTAHRLTKIIDPFGNYALYSLDALGDVTERALYLPNNSSTFDRTASFDALGRQIKDNSLVLGASSLFTYDNNGNRLTIKDPLGNTTANAFDALNRLATITDANTPVPGVTQFSYDAHDRTTTATDPNGNTTTYVYDGFGDLIQEASPDSGITKFWFDTDGNLLVSVPANNIATRHTYDALDRVLTTTYPDTTLNVAYSYDQTGSGFNFGVGRLTTVTDASGALNRTYDEQGNVLSETRKNIPGSTGTTLTTTYTFDAASRVASITYPSGAQVTYTRDAMGRITSIPFTAVSADSTTVIPASGISYAPFGPPTQIKFNNGDIDNYAYDKDYWLTSILSTQLSYKENLTYGQDQAHNLFSVTDAINPANSQQLRYDTLNRLIVSNSGSGGYGNITYTYDKNGNLTSFSQGGTTYTESYNPNTNQIAGTSWPGNSTSFSYSPTGNITGETLNGSTVFTAAYNNADRLYSETGFSPATSSTTYDAFGKRITKTNPGASPILFTYDHGGKLIEENSVGQITDYIYANGVLVGDWQPSQHQLSFVHTDRIGMPIATTNMSDQTVWQMTYLPNGGVQTLAGSIANNIRFPGQYHDGSIAKFVGKAQ